MSWGGQSGPYLLHIIARRSDRTRSLKLQTSTLATLLGAKLKDLVFDTWSIRYTGTRTEPINLQIFASWRAKLGLDLYVQVNGYMFLVDKRGARTPDSPEELEKFLGECGRSLTSDPPEQVTFDDPEEIELFLSSFKTDEMTGRVDRIGKFSAWHLLIAQSSLPERDKKKLEVGILDVMVTLLLAAKRAVEYGAAIRSTPKSRLNIFVNRIEGIDFIRGTATGIRSLWDKVFDLTPIVFTEIDARRIDDAKSKKGAFLKEMAKLSEPGWEVVSNYLADLELYDDRYRTAEIHKAGGLVSKHLLKDKVDLNEGITIWNATLGPIETWAELMRVRLTSQSVAASSTDSNPDTSTE